MHDIQKAIDTCYNILDHLKIHTGNVSSIRPHNNPKAPRSLCIDNGDCSFDILIEDAYLRDDVDETLLVGIILHELLHTIPDCFEHTGKWLEYAKLITEKTDYDLMELNHGVYDLTHHDATPRHKIVCPVCGSYSLIRHSRANWDPNRPGGGWRCRCGCRMETVF